MSLPCSPRIAACSRSRLGDPSATFGVRGLGHQLHDVDCPGHMIVPARPRSPQVPSLLAMSFCSPEACSAKFIRSLFPWTRLREHSGLKDMLADTLRCRVCHVSAFSSLFVVAAAAEEAPPPLGVQEYRFEPESLQQDLGGEGTYIANCVGTSRRNPL